jgi:hypothetical protein
MAAWELKRMGDIRPRRGLLIGALLTGAVVAFPVIGATADGTASVGGAGLMVGGVVTAVGDGSGPAAPVGAGLNSSVRLPARASLRGAGASLNNGPEAVAREAHSAGSGGAAQATWHAVSAGNADAGGNAPAGPTWPAAGAGLVVQSDRPVVGAGLGGPEMGGKSRVGSGAGIRLGAAKVAFE